MNRDKKLRVYQEVQLLPSQEVGVNFLLGRVFQQIHLALVEALSDEGVSQIGVSFPQYSYEDRKLGEQLRLFAADYNQLNELNVFRWLRSFKGYIEISKILDVPENIGGYAYFKRERSKSSLARIARRKANREHISFEDAMKLLSGFDERFSDAPFVNIRSLNTNQQFKLFILKEECSNSNNNGFSSYGLSAESSVPLF